MRTLAMLIFSAFASANLQAQWGGELRFCLHSEPRTLNPVMVDDDASETVRFLTGGTLLRVNRVSQQLEPELATSWKLEDGGRRIVFKLREGLSFSDGASFTAKDVAYTMQTLMDPNVHSVTGDAFRTGSGAVQTTERGKFEIAVTFPEAVAGVAALLSGRHHVAVIPAARTRCHGTISDRGTQGRRIHPALAQPVLLEDRARQAAALPRFRAP